MNKFMRERHIDGALRFGLFLEDEILVLEWAQKVELGDTQRIDYKNLLGRFRNGSVEFYELQHTEQPLKLTRYRIRHYLRLLVEDLNGGRGRTSHGHYLVGNVTKLAEGADRYFLRLPHFEPEFDLRVHIFRPLGVIGIRDYPVIWPLLNIASLVFYLAVTAWSVWQVLFLASKPRPQALLEVSSWLAAAASQPICHPLGLSGCQAGRCDQLNEESPLR
jgi:hypothetical protein